MLLRITTVIAAICFCSLCFAEMTETKHVREKDISADAGLLEKILLRKPDDTLTMKRLVKIYFVSEKFPEAEKMATRHLLIKKDRETAYIKIISLACQKKFKQAERDIDVFLKDYSVSPDDQDIVKIKKVLIAESRETNAYPAGMTGFGPGDNKKILCLLDREKKMLGFDLKNSRLFIVPYNSAEIKYLEKTPVYLQDIEIEKIMFLSVSSDFKDILATVRTGKYRSEILARHDSGNGWSSWESVAQMNPGSWNAFGNFSPASKFVFFSSNADSASGLEIYYTSKNPDGSWDDPQKLPGINTGLDEYSVFFHPDGETLYFSSNGYTGMGGFDIYGAKLKRSDSGLEVTQIQNLKEANSYRNETFPLLVDSRGEISVMNFYVADKTGIYTGKTPTVKPVPVTYFNGYVYDRKTNKPVADAEVSIMRVDQNDSTEDFDRTTDSKSYIGASLKSGSEHIITINAKNYLYQRKNIVIEQDRDVVEKKFYLERGRIDKGFVIVATNVNFDTGSAIIKKNSSAELQGIYNFMKINPYVVVEISGFTDNVGSYEFNRKLSLQRAKAIAKYLSGRGIEKKRMKTRGYAYLKNVASNKTEEGRRLNRRVEITVIDKK